MINELIRRRASVAATVSSIKDARQVLTRLLPARLINLQRLHRPILRKTIFPFDFLPSRDRGAVEVDPSRRSCHARGDTSSFSAFYAANIQSFFLLTTTSILFHGFCSW